MTEYNELTNALSALRAHATKKNKSILGSITILDGYVQELNDKARDFHEIKNDISQSLKSLKALNPFWKAALINILIAATIVGLLFMLVNYSFTGNVLFFWNKKEHALIEDLQYTVNNLSEIIEPFKLGDSSTLSLIERVERLENLLQNHTTQVDREIKELTEMAKNNRPRSASATSFFTAPTPDPDPDPDPDPIEPKQRNTRSLSQ